MVDGAPTNQKINGLYEKQAGLVNGHPVYCALGDYERWLLAPSALNGHWVITSDADGAKAFVFAAMPPHRGVLPTGACLTGACLSSLLIGGLPSFALVCGFVIGVWMETENEKLINVGLPCKAEQSWTTSRGAQLVNAPKLVVRRVSTPADYVARPLALRPSLPPLVLETMAGGALSHGITGAALKAADFLGRFDPLLSSLGTYQLVNQMPLYQHAEHTDVWLSLAASGAWKVQQGNDFTKRRDLCYFSLADPSCAPPHLSGAAWKVWDGNELVDEPRLRAVRATAPSKKRKREGGDEGEDKKRGGKAVSHGGGGGLLEASEDCEVTGSISKAQKDRAALASAENVDSDLE